LVSIVSICTDRVLDCMGQVTSEVIRFEFVVSFAIVTDRVNFPTVSDAPESDQTAPVVESPCVPLIRFA
jgi:hypothetical protein